MGERRPGGVTALMWAMIVVGLLGLLGNGLSAAGSAASGAMMDLAAQTQEATFSDLEGLDDEAARDLLEGQREMMADMAEVARRTRPVTLALGVLGMLVSGFLVFAAFRGLRGGGAAALFQRALWAAGVWSVAKFAVGAWLQRLQAASTGAELERMMGLAAEASGEGGPVMDVAGMQEAIVAVTLAFGALVVVAKLMFYGYGLWYARQPEARAWLVDALGIEEADPVQGLGD